MVNRILIEPYDSTWAVRFATLRDRLKSALGPLALRIEHDREAYTQAKTEFVEALLREATA